jgi:CsoR family transcriptional regulator, copper-sensing transcriptional repressor
MYTPSGILPLVKQETKRAMDRRLARLEGQVSGLRKMVQEDRYCLDILTQLGAIKGALDQVGAELVASHLETCVLGHGTESEHEHCKPMSQEELLDEFRLTLSRLMR